MEELESMDKYTEMAVQMSMMYGPKLILAILTLIIGLWIISALVNGMRRGFERSAMEQTLSNFLLSLTSVGAKALLLISVAAMVGIETTSFIAVLGAAGLAVGLALQGSLANFAGGVLILIFKPYRVGDVIETVGHTGSVKGIEIFNTVMTTPDNKTIIVPNGAVSNNPLVNFSTQDTRRVDIVFGIGYDDDLKLAKQVLTDLITADERILDDPEPMIVVSNLGASSVDITTRSWVNAADYWGVFFDLTENAKLALDANNISIPYPQQDVHIHNG